MFELDRVVGMNYGETTKMVIESANNFAIAPICVTFFP